MAYQKTVSVLQEYREADGTYTIVLPINTTDEVLTDPVKNITLTWKLSDVDNTITSNRDSVIDDLMTLTKQMSSFMDKPLQLNHVYINDFQTLNNITMTGGGFLPGKIFI